MNGINSINDIFQIILQIIVSILSVVGCLSCINYVYENHISKSAKQRKADFIKEGACLVINADEIGDKLEYYIRKIQNEINNNRHIYIKKIVLYTKTVDFMQDANEQCYENISADNELVQICELLASDYSNIVFVKGKCIDSAIL